MPPTASSCAEAAGASGRRGRGGSRRRSRSPSPAPPRCRCTAPQGRRGPWGWGRAAGCACDRRGRRGKTSRRCRSTAAVTSRSRRRRRRGRGGARGTWQADYRRETSERHRTPPVETHTATDTRFASMGIDIEVLRHGIGINPSKYQSIDWRLDGSFLTLFLDTTANSSTEFSTQRL